MRQLALGFMWLFSMTLLAGCPADMPPLAAFRSFPSAGEEPLTVQFSDFSLPGGQPIQSWLWDFGDGTQSTEQNPVHIYVNPGAYDVSLTITTPLGTDSEVIVNHIRVSLDFQIHVLNESVFPLTELYVVDADAGSLGSNRISRFVAPDSGRTLATKYTKGQQIVAAVVLADDIEVGLPVAGNLQTLEMPDDFVTLHVTGDSIDTLEIEYFYGLP